MTSRGPGHIFRGPTGFRMEWYITSPPASLFRLPPGATVTRLKPGQQ
jgi:hypothetical protein